MSASLNELWGMINSQQLFLMIPLCAVILPINAAGFFSQIRQISAFQFFSTNDWINEWLKLEPTDPFNDNFNELGLGTRHMLNNLGTLFIFFIVYPLLVLLYYLVHPFRNCCRCCKRIDKKLERDLFYSMILTGIIESYATLALCCLVSFPSL